MTMRAIVGSTFTGIPPSASAPAIWRAMDFTAGPGNSMPRKLISRMVNRAVPGRSIASVPPRRSGSRGSTNAANGPSASCGSARVSRRACTASEPSSSSTRSESYVLRTRQSIPLPMREATSLGVSTTVSGPALVARLPTFVCPEATALGVGAPTAVSATGGRACERPNQRAPVRRIGSRNHHSSSSTAAIATTQPRRRSPLRQPFMVFHLIHRPTRLERALHQIQIGNDHRLGKRGGRQRVLESGEVVRTRLSPRAAERQVRLKSPGLCWKAERREDLLHAVLQQLERRIGCDARPHDARPPEIGKHSKSFDVQTHGATTDLPQRSTKIGLARIIYITEKLEREMKSLGAHPLHGQGPIAHGPDRVPQPLAHVLRKIQGDEGSNRLPRR